MYIHLGDTGRRSGNLRPKLMGNSFVRLNANCQHIWFGTAAESAVEEMCRRLLEYNINLRYTSVEAPFRSDVEKDPAPPPFSISNPTAASVSVCVCGLTQPFCRSPTT